MYLGTIVGNLVMHFIAMDMMPQWYCLCISCKCTVLSFVVSSHFPLNVPGRRITLLAPMIAALSSSSH